MGDFFVSGWLEQNKCFGRNAFRQRSSVEAEPLDAAASTTHKCCFPEHAGDVTLLV